MCLIGAVLLCPNILHSQDPDTLWTAEIQQPSKISTGNIWTEDQWEDATNNIDYSGKPPEPEEPVDFEFQEPSGPTWFDRFLETRGAQIIILCVILAVLAYFLIRFLMDKPLGQDKKVISKTYSLESLEENLEESDMDHFLRLALESNDYRSAIRIFYLTIIKVLNEKKMIKWRREKTNNDYVREMQLTPYGSQFRNVTRAFELVWYGNAIIAQREYQSLEPQFRRFLKNFQDGDR